MKIGPFCCFCLLLANLAYTQTWTLLDLPVAGRYDDLFFLNDSIGWTCNSEGNSFKTTDTGAHWTQHTVSDNNYLRSIEFMDADTGFCGGLYTGKNLFKTTDGGQTWVNISSQLPGFQGGICGLSCPGGQVVYGCGVWSSPAYFIKSTDGGVTWQKKDMSAYASALVDILFISRDTGWVSGRNPNGYGVILHTTDAGNTWQTIYISTFSGDYVWKLQRLSAETWFASIERDPFVSAKTEILTSTDGGLHFLPITVSYSYYRLQAVGFLTPARGWTGDNALFETTDGGSSWQNVNGVDLNGNSFNRFFRINCNRAFLTADKVYRYDALPNGTHDPLPPCHNQDMHTLKVSPNPTTGTFQIAIGLHQKTTVILKIYAYNGGYEEVLWTGEHEEGDYLLQASLAGKSAGVYVVYLKTHHGAQYTLVEVIH